MAEFLMQFSLFPLVLTLGCYQIGLWCQKKWKSPLLNPILIGMVLVIGVLLLTGVPNEHYQAGTAHMTWLLTPATVCLALPLYENLKVLKKSLPAILIGILAGTLTSLAFVFVLCRVFSLDRALTVSMLPKSVTSAFGMVLSEQNGGYGALSAASIIITGVLGCLVGSVLCKLFKIKDPVAQGVAFGTASHVGGTTRALELGSLQGAVSSLALAIAGLLTAVLFPLVILFV
ncbi:MAG: LrgB family protein [Oscillospiraceae bacterium]|nr:LrgB family protein [Oscillospiraceae bacterium]